MTVEGGHEHDDDEPEDEARTGDRQGGIGHLRPPAVLGDLPPGGAHRRLAADVLRQGQDALPAGVDGARVVRGGAAPRPGNADYPKAIAAYRRILAAFRAGE